MPYASNPLDGVRIYFEDDGGTGPPVLFTYGFMDPIPAARSLGIARALESECRLIFVDHRGHGRSDKPHDQAAYALSTRVADIVAVLDALALQRAHFAGISWGARLGFALGEYAPERLTSLVLSANQPYAWDESWPIVKAISEGIRGIQSGGMMSVLGWFEAYTGRQLLEPERSWLLENDPDAIEAAWASALREGAVSEDLTRWQIPCLIAAGEKDDMYENALRSAAEIPGASFLSLPDQDHLASVNEVDVLLAGMRRLFQNVT